MPTTLVCGDDPYLEKREVDKLLEGGETARFPSFTREALDALSLMTHDKNVPYMDYVAKIKGNDIARTVKRRIFRIYTVKSRSDRHIVRITVRCIHGISAFHIYNETRYIKRKKRKT